MIKSFIATTREIDDAEAAAAEIVSAINPKENLLKHSLGIISCFSEFIDTGALKAVCDAMPFECIGTTTCICSANREVDQVMLTITVLTSDDCPFRTIEIPVSNDHEKSIESVLGDILRESEEKPALFLTYFPLINDISGDMMLTAIDRVTGGIPLFGTTAVDHNADYSTSCTIHNGDAFRESIVLGAIYGNPEFLFEMVSLNEEKIRNQKAIITESNGNILIGVNGKSALAYLGEIGLAEEEIAAGVGIIPLIVDYKDGTKAVARAVFALTPEGYAVCGGAVPVNATLGIGSIDKEDVLQTTAKTLVPFLRDKTVILSYSCIARYLVLGLDNTAEADKIISVIGEYDYMFACSGGEICPLVDSRGNLKNFYHNYTIAFCRLS